MDSTRLDDVRERAQTASGECASCAWKFTYAEDVPLLLAEIEKLEKDKKRVWEAGSTLAHAFAFPHAAKKEHKRQAMREFGYDDPEWWE